METKGLEDITEAAHQYRKSVFASMCELRIVIDELETITAKADWPYPSCGHILLGVR